MGININLLAWLEEQEQSKGLRIVGDADSLVDALGAFDLLSDELLEDYMGEALEQMKEAKEYSVGRYRVIISGPHSSRGQDHAHVKLQNGKQIWSVNIDGTGHDGYHGVRMEKKPYQFLADKGFELSDDRFIESSDDDDLLTMTIRMVD